MFCQQTQLHLQAIKLWREMFRGFIWPRGKKGLRLVNVRGLLKTLSVYGAKSLPWQRPRMWMGNCFIPLMRIAERTARHAHLPLAWKGAYTGALCFHKYLTLEIYILYNYIPFNSCRWDKDLWISHWPVICGLIVSESG